MRPPPPVRLRQLPNKPVKATAGTPALLFASALLASCGAADTDPGPGGVTVGEARALDEAAEMLDSRRLPAEALEDPATPASADSTPAE